MYIWRHGICQVDNVKMMQHISKCVSFYGNKYDEAIFAIGIIKKVTE